MAATNLKINWLDHAIDGFYRVGDIGVEDTYVLRKLLELERR